MQKLTQSSTEVSVLDFSMYWQARVWGQNRLGEGRAQWLANLHHSAGRGGVGRGHLVDHVARKSVQGAGMGRIFALQDGWFAGVTSFANVGIEFHAPQERQVKLVSGALAAALGEDINLILAM